MLYVCACVDVYHCLDMSGLLVRNWVHSLPLHTPWDRRSFSYNTLEAARDETWALVLKNLERGQQKSTAEMGQGEYSM